ncbi:uncharacterized protein N7503_001263 [Penicillium pulvis]|uniref:uncharacterized protein n=1 Tax=Penicillium pulvis TaxID=1562058 RepID=UPI0025497017|nr:uncharacterized protein N7503_001263 [Penicillium pulvis]KAJ5809045.1 hypothetical protein N7503_001263 [Penicillium pulvis]
MPVFVSWYHPTGFWRNGLDESNGDFGMNDRAIFIFHLILLFLALASTFSQILDAGMSDSLTAVNIAHLLFTLCLILVPDALPDFWIFMYCVSPVTYLMGGMVKAGVANARINCAPIDLLNIPLPSANGSASSCVNYLADYIRTAGGRVLISNTSIASEDCVFCAVTDANITLPALGMDVATRWRGLGIFACLIVRHQ